MKEVYEARAKLIRVGSVIKAKRIIRFCNGCFHSPNISYIATLGTLPYYIVNFDDYEVVIY